MIALNDFSILGINLLRNLQFSFLNSHAAFDTLRPWCLGRFEVNICVGDTFFLLLCRALLLIRHGPLATVGSIVMTMKLYCIDTIPTACNSANSTVSQQLTTSQHRILDFELFLRIRVRNSQHCQYSTDGQNMFTFFFTSDQNATIIIDAEHVTSQKCRSTDNYCWRLSIHHRWP